MSSRNPHSLSRRRLVILGLSVLAGCGFAPVYGTDSSASTLRGSIAYDMPDTPSGFHLRNRFEERLGQTEETRFRLAVSIDVSESLIGIGSDNAPSRVNLLGTASYTLTDLGGNTRSTGTVTNFTSYSTTGTTVATRAAQRDASERLMINLADLVVTRLLADPAAVAP